MLLFFWMLSFKPAFSFSYFTFNKRLFCSSSLSAMSGLIWIYKVIDISPSNLDPSLCFIQPGMIDDVFCMMYSAYKLHKQDDNIQLSYTPLPIWNQSVVPCPILTVASWPAYRFLRRQVRWSSSPIFWRIFQVCCDTNSQRRWCSQWSRGRFVFSWNSLAFSMIQWMLAI